jgi:hypothetical protein
MLRGGSSAWRDSFLGIKPLSIFGKCSFGSWCMCVRVCVCGVCVYMWCVVYYEMFICMCTCKFTHVVCMCKCVCIHARELKDSVAETGEREDQAQMPIRR